MKLSKYEEEVLTQVRGTTGSHIRMMGDKQFNAACNRLVKKGKLKFYPYTRDKRFDVWMIPFEDSK